MSATLAMKQVYLIIVCLAVFLLFISYVAYQRSDRRRSKLDNVEEDKCDHQPLPLSNLQKNTSLDEMIKLLRSSKSETAYSDYVALWSNEETLILHALKSLSLNKTMRVENTIDAVIFYRLVELMTWGWITLREEAFHIVKEFCANNASHHRDDYITLETIELIKSLWLHPFDDVSEYAVELLDMLNISIDVPLIHDDDRGHFDADHAGYSDDSEDLCEQKNSTSSSNEDVRDDAWAQSAFSTIDKGATDSSVASESSSSSSSSSSSEFEESSDSS